MSLFALGDTHLSFGAEKPMDIFGGWQNYEERLEKNWRAIVRDDDCVVICGDISWAMHLSDAVPDFAFLNSLPGRKLLMKGNHDYWWETKSKLVRLFSENGFENFEVLHNSAYLVSGVAVAGTKGWFFESGAPDEAKALNRELCRLKASLEEAKMLGGDEMIAFLHYPPLTLKQECREITSMLEDYGVSRCFFGHLHGQGIAAAFEGEHNGVNYALISGDRLGFCPKLIVK